MRLKKLAIAVAGMAIPAIALAEVTTVETAQGKTTLADNDEMHITSAVNPIETGASVNLKGDNAWLYFDAVKPSAVEADWLKYVTVDGKKAAHPANVRLAEWGTGCVVIPNGASYDSHALTVYDQINCQGNSKTYEIETFHTDLGDWDNKIKSIKLRRGYMATLANNPDGTGHSRVFIAADGDLQIDVLPEGFLTYMGEEGAYDDAAAESFVSFIRVFRWEWSGKKGWAGWHASEIALSNVDSYYPWSAGMLEDAPEDGFYQMDREFVPIKQQPYWPSWDNIMSLKKITHCLGYNEPDHTDQANATVDQAISDWPNMLRTGLRLGSPAPSSVWTKWSPEFWRLIIKYNYRCDINVSHVYEYIDGNGWQQRVNRMVSESEGRPCWVTEYNNGANWTSEKWPGGDRSANEANLEHQRQWMENILPALDGIDKLERAFFYNWVEDCRAIILNGELTPAGEVFANHVSTPAFKSSQAYDHVWKIAPPYFTTNVRGDAVVFKMYDHNGETGTGYEVVCKTFDDWQVLSTLTRGVDYEPGTTFTVKVMIPEGECSPTLAVRAIGYRGQVSELSDEVVCGSETLGVPQPKLVSADGYSIKFEWEPIEGATGYAVRRGEDRKNLIFLGTTAETTYLDDTTEPETPYYYSVGAYNANSPVSYSGTWRFYSNTAGMAEIVSDELSMSVENGALVIDSPVACELPVFTTMGRVAAVIYVEPGVNVIDSLPKGIYIANRQKIAIR